MRNIAESVRNLLRMEARERRVNVESMTTRWVMERFLHRLSISAHHSHLVLKGGLLFTVWEGDFLRSTGDVDLHDLDNENSGKMSALISEIARTEPAGGPDGINFDLSSLRSEVLIGSMLPGERVTTSASIGSTAVRLKVDTGFAHAITPGTERRWYRPLLVGYPASSLLCYPVETVIAEKLAVIVEFGRDNTRIRDYYDLWALAGRQPHDGSMLLEAVSNTFARRDAGKFLERTDGYWQGALTADYVTPAIEKTWHNWLRAHVPQIVPSSFRDVVARVAQFSLPILLAARDGAKHPGRWWPTVGWSRPHQPFVS